MSTRLTYHGAASFEIVGPTHRILIDPFLSQNPMAPCAPDELETPDVILCQPRGVRPLRRHARRSRSEPEPRSSATPRCARC